MTSLTDWSSKLRRLFVRCRFPAMTAAAIAACGQPAIDATPQRAPNAPGPLTRTITTTQVHFRSTKSFISHPGDTIDVPAFAGDTLSPQTLTSSDPDTVTVNAIGRLWGRKAGSARITGAGGGHIDVTVLDIKDLRLSPSKLSVAVGGTAPITASTSDGRIIDNDALHWTTTNPSLAYVLGPNVVAGKHDGIAHLTGSFGDMQATISVIVEPPRTRGPAFAKAPMTVRAGDLAHYELTSALPVLWSSSNPKKLALVSPGIFRGKQLGLSTVCAIAAADQHACIDVEVTK